MVQDTLLCRTIVETGTEVGDALVGSDDKVAVTFEVTAPTFKPGNINYICMVDGEGRESSTDVEDFKLEPSIKVVPASANSGDTVNVFAQDYPRSAGFALLKIGCCSPARTSPTSCRVGASAPVSPTTVQRKFPSTFPEASKACCASTPRWGTVNEDPRTARSPLPALS